MGQAKLKRTMAHNGNQTGANRAQSGALVDAPPQGNTGGTVLTESQVDGNRMGTDRLRVNISVPQGIHDALAGIAEKTGMSVAQAALMALTAGLPALREQVEAVKALRA